VAGFEGPTPAQVFILRLYLSDAGHRTIRTPEKKFAGLEHSGESGAPLPTEILLSVSQRRARDQRNAADFLAYLILIPLAACLFSIVLSFEYEAFEAVFIQMVAE